MPRDGANQYSIPAGTHGITDYTVESSKYNAFVDDIANDLNLARPIVAGGTGATTAAQALINLGGEKSAQVITNYSSATFVAGSFYSATSATAPPVAGHAFAGIAYYNDASNLTLEARDLTDTALTVYVRVMTAGVWGSWFVEGSGEFVAKTGDTITGQLIVKPASADAQVNLNAPTGAFNNRLKGAKNDLLRWTLLLGDSTSESGGNAGSNLGIVSYNDAGSALDTVLSINRSTGLITAKGDPTAPLGIVTKQSLEGRAVLFDSAQTLSGGQQTQARNNIGAASAGAPDTGAVRFDSVQSLSGPQKVQARSNIGAAISTFAQVQTSGAISAGTANVTFTNINSEDVLLIMNGVYAPAIVASKMEISIDNGVTWTSTPFTFAASGFNTSARYGSCLIQGLKAGYAHGRSFGPVATALGKDAVSSALGSTFQFWEVSAGAQINALRITVPGQTFSAGQFDLWGRG